jgi:hypothetical protein
MQRLEDIYIYIYIYIFMSLGGKGLSRTEGMEKMCIYFPEFIT